MWKPWHSSAIFFSLIGYGLNLKYLILKYQDKSKWNETNLFQWRNMEGRGGWRGGAKYSLCFILRFIIFLLKKRISSPWVFKVKYNFSVTELWTNKFHSFRFWIETVRRQLDFINKIIIILFVEAGLEKERPDDIFTEERLGELESVSRKQSEIIDNIEEALNDMNIETANTGSRLNILESIAAKQKQERYWKIINPLSTFINGLIPPPHSTSNLNVK